MMPRFNSTCTGRLSYERDALLQSVIERAGFKALIAQELEEEQEKKQQLATLPGVLNHFNLEGLQDRPVQSEIVQLLLLTKDDARFATCVLVHGMGGTGKTVRLMTFQNA